METWKDARRRGDVGQAGNCRRGGAAATCVAKMHFSPLSSRFSSAARTAKMLSSLPSLPRNAATLARNCATPAGCGE
eukprot:7134316-Alexandrium_andersonii.AAC.1